MGDEKIRILLIEDNPGDARLIRESLNAKGSTSFVLEHAERLSIGLARLARGDIDVVLLDLSLPDSQGLDGLNKICAQTPKVPVVVMSGLRDEAVAINAVQEGAQDYLVKGNVDSDLLVRSLYYAIERQYLRVALGESEARYRLLADNAADVIWTANMKWQMTYVSPSIKRLLGYTVEEMKRLAIKDILTHDSFNQAAKLIRNQIDIMTPGLQYPSLSLTLEHVRKDGSTLWAEVMLSFLWDKDGKLNEVLGVTREITERKKAEEALRESEQRYRLLAENVKDIIWTRDMNLHTTYVSPSVTQISGYSVEEVMSLSIEESLTPASLEIVQSTLAKMIAEVKEQKDSSETVVLEVELIHKEGRIVPVEMKVNLLHDSTGRPTGFLGVTRDITERKKAEEALRESEEELRAIFDSSGNGIALLDLEGRVIRVNKRVLEVGGYDLEDISGKPLALLNMFTPESIERMFSVKDMVLSSHVVTTLECELCTKSGIKMSLEINVGPFFLKGQLFGLVAVMTDITERKRAEEALRQSEERYRLLAENVKDVISAIDMNLRLTYVSPSVTHLLGYSVEEAMALTLEEGLTAASYEKLMRAFAEGMAAEKKGDRSLPMSLVFELEAKHKDGHLVPVEMMVNLLRDVEGKPVGILGVSRDITERKKAEDVLRKSEEKLRRYLESSPDAIYINDEKGTFLYGNLVAERMIGYSKEELIGQSFLELNLLPPEYLLKAAKTLELNMSGKPTGPDEFELFRKDGSRVFIEICTYPMIQGDKIEIIGIARDVTERKKMEQELRRLSDAVRMSTDSIVISDLEGNIVDVNEATVKIQGANGKADLIGLKYSDFIAPEEQEKALSDLSRLIEERYVNDIEYHILTRDGRRVLVETNASVMRGRNGEPVGVVAITRDITERKRMEEALKENEERFRVVFEGTSLGIALVDMKTNVLGINPAFEQMLGYSFEEFSKLTSLEYLYPEDAMADANLYIEMLKGKRDHYTIDKRYIRKDGAIVWGRQNLSVVRDAAGKPRYFIAMLEDITERKRIEEALRHSEHNYRVLFEGTIDGMFVTDVETVKIVLANQTAAKMCGFDSAENATGINPLDLVHPDDRERVLGFFMEDASGEGNQEVHEFRAITKDGREIWISGMGTRIEYGGKLAVLSSIRDITERKEMEEERQRMEERLRLAGRLAAVGELAAGVAHELNNPIAAIQGFAQFLTARKDLEETLRKDLDTIYRESQRAAKITQNLLSFARKHDPEKHLISINDVIENILEMQDHLMKINNIELEVELAPDLPKTMADFHQMQQVFMNIVNNAEQAMVEAQGRGKLVVKTKRAGKIIQISFADNGPGISEENIKRIFDPFFTTKEVGKGTGLGLSICYGLVEAHSGRIYAKSKLGQGATFVVELPIVSENELVTEAALLKPGSRGVKWKKQRERY